MEIRNTSLHANPTHVATRAAEIAKGVQGRLGELTQKGGVRLRAETAETALPAKELATKAVGSDPMTKEEGR